MNLNEKEQQTEFALWSILFLACVGLILMALAGVF